MDLTRTITDIVPGFGSVVAGTDGETGFDDDFTVWDASEVLAIAEEVYFTGSVSVTVSGSEALFSAEIIGGGGFSAFASMWLRRFLLPRRINLLPPRFVAIRRHKMRHRRSE